MDSTNIGNETISLKSILIGYLRHWRLFLGTFVISLIPAVLYLIYYPTTYEIMARFKVQDDTSMSSGNMSLGDAAGLMKSFGLSGGGTLCLLPFLFYQMTVPHQTHALLNPP